MRYLKILGTAMVVMVLWGLGSFKAAAMEGPPDLPRDLPGHQDARRRFACRLQERRRPMA